MQSISLKLMSSDHKAVISKVEGMKERIKEEWVILMCLDTMVFSVVLAVV